MKEILRSNMPGTYYVKIAGMNIAEMLQKIPEIWKECGSHDITFQYRTQKGRRNNKNQGNHAQVTKKKTRYQVRLCYCRQQKGYLAKDCTWNKNMKPSNSDKVSMWMIYVTTMSELVKVSIICVDDT